MLLNRAVWSTWVVPFVLVAALSSGAEQVRPALVPDASRAVIDGRVAVGSWPAVGGKIVGPEGFTVHLASDETLEEELVFPAGAWFQPPPGRYRVWLEGAEPGSPDLRITPTFTVLTYRGNPFRGRGFATQAEVVPAGRVVLPPEEALQPHQSLRLLHLDAVDETGRITRGFLRAVPAERQGEPVLMPAGRVVGLLYDGKKKGYVAASRPVEVRAEGTATIPTAPEKGVADVLAILQRHEGVEMATEDDLEVYLEDATGRERRPDVVVPAFEWVYALWYGVDGRAARVRAESGTGYLPSTEVVLEPGGVATLRGDLLARPYLDVRLELPPELRPAEAVLSVGRRDTRTLVVREEIPVDDPDAVTRLDGLPATGLDLHLLLKSKPLWRLEERVDLSDGTGREVVFRPRAILLSGTIYHGDEATPGKVTLEVFDTKRLDPEGSTFEAEVDDEGGYRVLLYDGGRYFIHVDLPDLPGPPMPILHVPYIREDTVFDLRIPRTALRVQVRDAATGAPIEGARVDVSNKFLIDWMEPVEKGDAPSWSHSGEDGWAILPPPYPGDLVVWASRDGYLESERVRARVGRDERSELVVELQPEGRTAPLRLLLPDGRPAGGAEVRAQASVWDGQAVWQGAADGEGRVGVPAPAEEGWLLVRHPEAGSWIQKWAPVGDDPVTWRLPAAAAPATFRTVGLDGDPAPWVGFAIRFPTTWVVGTSLGWLTRSPVAASHENALWTARHLPAETLQVYAGDATTLSLAVNGLLDGAAVELSPPWPAQPVDVPVSTRR